MAVVVVATDANEAIESTLFLGRLRTGVDALGFSEELLDARSCSEVLSVSILIWGRVNDVRSVILSALARSGVDNNCIRWV